MMDMFWAQMENAQHSIPLPILTQIADYMTTLYSTNVYNAQVDFSSTLKENVNKSIHCAELTTIKMDYVWVVMLVLLWILSMENVFNQLSSQILVQMWEIATNMILLTMFVWNVLKVAISTLQESAKDTTMSIARLQALTSSHVYNVTMVMHLMQFKESVLSLIIIALHGKMENVRHVLKDFILTIP